MSNSLPEWCEAEEWCPITVTAELLGRKWHPIIIHRLLQEPLRFNELKRKTGSISDKVLSNSLEDLRQKNVVEKQELGGTPTKVQYRLTERGESLKPVIESMKNWGKKATT